MSDELREMVADLVRFNKDPLAIAEEAIALIRNETLEEAAKAADDEAYGFPPEMLTKHGVGYERACRDTAAAIRAMKGSPWKGSPWKCPIKHPGCTSNCGSYGCGN